MLEPRRLAAKSIAARMASFLGEEIGETVGFRIRFETRVSAKTRIEVLTEGIMTRMIHSDKALEGVGLVIFDEFHERSIHADVAMALCRETQQILRPDLRLLIMSATLDTQLLARLLNAPVSISKGRQHPVEIIYTGQQDVLMLAEMTVSTTLEAVHSHKEGDILVFLPGESEIKKCEELLRKKLRNCSIHPLYGQLSWGKQHAAIMPHKQGKRKIILATSIAETSLTIEGVKIVIDTGFGRTMRFDPNTGLSRLETVQISKDSADQRAGRAGRLEPGICYRLWTEANHSRLAEYRTPEILEADLSSLVLDMAQWDIMDMEQLTWLSPPPQAALMQATETLHQLNALENGRITAHGKKIHSLPCHPRIAHMLVMAEESGKLDLATDLASLLEERDPMPRETGININLRIEALRRYRKENGQGKRLGQIEKVAQSYRKLFNIEADNGAVDHYESGVFLAHAYPERIACARPGNNAQYQLANGKYASASHKDDLAHELWLVIAHLNAREGIGKIFLASPLNPKDLAPMVKNRKVISWDTEDGELLASQDLRIGNIVLQSKPLPEPDEEQRIPAISEAIKREGDRLLNFNEEVKQWQLRILSLRKWYPLEGWPDVSTQALLMTNREWLYEYLKEVKTPEDLKKIDLLEILKNRLDSEKKDKAAILAPAYLNINNLKMKLEYRPNGMPPVVKIKEKEGRALTKPLTINEGKIEICFE